MDAENVNPQEELKRLEERIETATELAELKPIFFRLNEIIRSFPGDFDVQFTADEVKRHLIAHGTLFKQREASAAPPPATAPPPPPPAPPAVPPPPAAPPEPPAVPAAKPENPPQPQTPPAAPPDPARQRNRAVAAGPIAGLLVAAILIFLAAYQIRKRNAAAVEVDIATTPAGASVRVTAERPAGVPPGPGTVAACTSNCKLALPPGRYQVSATLNGFEPAAGAVTVTARQRAEARLALKPQAQSVRLLTDLNQGKVVVDNGPPADLQEGQLVLDKVAPGQHTVKVTGPNGDASFSFEAVDGRLPAVAGPVKARNMIAVLVASFGKQARIEASGGPWKLSVNGQPQGDAGPAGTELAGFHPGVNEIVLGEGRDRRNMSESFGAAPMLTAFLKTDVNAGTLIVATGQDDVRVFLNEKEYRRPTQRGEVRVQTLGKVAVRVAKSGFLDEPAQTVEVNKGAEVRVQFELKPRPQFGSLEIQGAMAGSEVVVDGKSAGTVGPDGSFSLGAIQPGGHTIELRREQYQPKRVERSFHAGEAVVLTGTDVVLAAASGTVKLTRNPASVAITYRRGEETESHEVRGDQIELPPGSYAFAASAPGFVESTTRVQLAAGENREVDFTLARERPPAPPPIVASGMAEFEDAPKWKKEGDSWVHKGGGFVPYKMPPKGVFTFTVQPLKGGKIRWCLQYLDSKNYLLYEMDRKSFWAGVIQKGTRLERVKAPHNLGNQKSFTIQIEVAPDRLVQKAQVGDQWKVLDTFVEEGRDFTQGKFGFLIQGNDEIAISDFQFLPK